MAATSPALHGTPKKTSVRTIESPAVTMAALARHIERCPPVEVEIWDRTDLDKRKHHRRAARLIFTTTGGRPIHRATWAQIWVPVARAGVRKVQVCTAFATTSRRS
jgi:hypothetical protein